MTIYFARMGEWIKIGYTAGEARKRIAQLQTGQPQRIVLLGTIDGERDAESGLHEHFSDFRVSGEWFEHDSIIDAVSYLIEGQLPWYYCRKHSNDRQNFEKICAACCPAKYTDLSAYEDETSTLPSHPYVQAWIDFADSPEEWGVEEPKSPSVDWRDKEINRKHAQNKRLKETIAEQKALIEELTAAKTCSAAQAAPSGREPLPYHHY